MSKVDELLSQLKECSKYDPLNESFDINSISTRIDNLKSQLLSSIGLTNATLDSQKMEIIKQVKVAPIDPSFRVITYPNIHYEKKYKFDASILFDFIMKKIDDHANSNDNSNFDVTSVIQEGISYTLKYLTGSTPSRYLTIDEFKKNYQLHVFGSYRKIEIYPKTLTLTALAQRNPYIISYIENRLLFTQIKNLNNYSKRVETDFLKLLKSNPELKYTLNSYMSCIERSIRALVNMYKIIRNVFIDIQNEYFNIFRQILRNAQYDHGHYFNECCIETNKYIKVLNENINNLENLNNIDTEQSLNTIGIEFIDSVQNRINKSRDIRDHLYKNLYILSNMDPSQKLTLKTYDGAFKPISLNVLKYINSIDEIMNSCTNISDLTHKSGLKLYNKETTNDINSLRSSIINDVRGNMSITTMSIDDIIKNITNLLSICKDIDTMFYSKINTWNISNDPNICDKFKNIIIATISIVDAIYFNIIDHLQYYIEITSNLIIKEEYYNDFKGN